MNKNLLKHPRSKYRHPFQYAVLWLRQWLRKLFQQEMTPHAIALGFAFGAFVGIFPTFGAGLILITLLGLVFKYNIPAAVIGTAVANPFLTPFWAFVSYKLGGWLLDFLPQTEVVLPKGFWSKILSVGSDYLVGNLLISLVVGVTSYYIVKPLVDLVEKRRSERRLLYGLTHKRKKKE